MIKQDNYIAGLYCRLSSDDGNLGESNSIATQKTLLRQYCQQQGFLIHDYYCDDGWSGTNFERPQFKRLLDDIEAGLVNLVIVKDLSRFGREYAQAGLYIEHYFEAKQIRFISVGENIDTINGVDNILMPITNVINSMFARESSRKTKAAHRARAAEGKFLGNHGPFGYIRDPEDRHHLIVDPPAAEVVRRIFKLFAEGVGYVRITKILRADGVLNPQAYFNQNNPDFYQSDYWRQPFDWHATSIRVILSNQVYVGDMVFGKTTTKGFYDKTRVKTAPEDRIIVESTHEPIISRELWDTVQKLMARKRRETHKGEIQMFAGLVKCSDCGSSLNVSYNKQRGKYTSLSCWVYKNYGKERCTSHSIGWQTLCTLVLTDIRRNAAAAKQAQPVYLEMLTHNKEAKRQKELARAKRELKSVEKRLAEIEKITTKLYEDNALGRIDEQQYRSMTGNYAQERGELQERQSALTAEIFQTEEIYANVQSFLTLIRRYTDIQELNTKILNELIDRIVVHEKTIDADGEKHQRVAIYYKFIGQLPDAEWLAAM